MAIKKLQNNFTTPEQSKRLLELGVPADSADCYWNDICGKPIPMQQGILYSDKRNQFRKVNVPVWSVGRLMEIFDMCYQQGSDEDCITESWILTQEAEENFGSYIEYLIKTFEVQQNYLNFSKLEE